MDENRTGIIYAIFYQKKVIYIGKTLCSIERRIKSHRTKCFKNNQEKKLYTFLRQTTSYDNFFSDLKFVIVKQCSINRIDYEEVKTINYCIDRGCILYNVQYVDTDLNKFYK